MASRNSLFRSSLPIAVLAIVQLCISFRPSTANAASFDCGSAHTAFEKKICSVPALSASDAAMAKSYFAAISVLSEPGKTILRNGQVQWRNVVERLCLGNKGDEGPVRCLQRRYDSRIKALGNAAVAIGPFLFSRIDTYKMAGKEAASGMPFELYRGVPRIDRPQSAIADQWNARMVQAMAAVSKQAFWCSDGEDEVSGDDFVDFDIRAASADLISVRVSHAEVCEDGHYFPAVQNITYLLKPSVLPIKATDVFRPGSGWEAYLGNRAVKHWTDADQGEETKDDSRSFFSDKINEDVRDPKSWSFTKEALVISFNPGDARATAEGIVEMRFPWNDLKRFLVQDAPIPR